MLDMYIAEGGNMMLDMYKKLDMFREHVTAEKEVDRFAKLEKEINRRLGLTEKNTVSIPKAMIDFYRHFGNDEEFLNAYEHFYRLEDIRVEDQALVFAEKYKHTGRLGIKLVSFGAPHMSVSYCPSDMHTWYSEGIFEMEHFFFDYACWQILSMLPFIAAVRMKTEAYQDFMTKDVHYFNDDPMYTTGGGLYSGYYKNMLLCYLSLEEELYIATRNEQDLKEFEQQFGLKLKMVKPKKPAKARNSSAQKKRLEALKEIKLGEMLQQLDAFRNHITAPKEVDTLTALGRKNNIVMPEALIEFYRHFGNDRDFMTAYYCFDKPEEISVEEGSLLFCYTHQYADRLGIALENLNAGNEEICETPLKIFLFHIAVWQIMNTRIAMAAVEMSRRKFDMFMKKGPCYFHNSELFTKDQRFRAAYYKTVLICYIVEEETMYVSAKEDHALNEFEEMFQLDLDWC